MSPTCPSATDLLRLLDGETTHNETSKLRVHLEGCASCRQKSAELTQLIDDIAAPLVAAPADEERARSLLQAISTAAPSPRPVRRRPQAAWLGLAGVAAAAALLVWLQRDPRPIGGHFTARGGAPTAEISRRVGVSLYAPLADRALVRGGARIPASTVLTAAYRNLDRARDVYLLLFAVDARGDIHWLYPAFTSARSDPESVRLPFSVDEKPLAESVVLDHPALGALRVFFVLSRQPLHVSAVEALPGDQLRPASLERRLPDSHIDELDVELVADSKGALR